MDVLPFTTDLVPPGRRLETFRHGAADYHVDAIGDPLAFSARWRLLVAGEVNLIESRISPVAYRRTHDDIAADGKDRISVLCVLDGISEGTIDGVPVSVGPDEAMVFDLLRPLDVHSPVPLHTLIVNLPRFLLDDVASGVGPVVPAGAELDLVRRQMTYLLDHAATIPSDEAVFHGRAIRDLLVRALLSQHGADEPAEVPLLSRIVAALDRDLAMPPNGDDLARELAAPQSAVAAALDSVGGLAQLIERRRLLGAYRLLCTPSETASIAAIAARCGMIDPADFSRRFRQAFRAAPREVRARRHAEVPRWAGGYRVASDYRDLLSTADD